MTNKFSQWKEHMERIYGKKTVVSNKWINKQWSSIEGRRPSLTQSTTNADTIIDTISHAPVPCLDALKAKLTDCARCKLSNGRKHVVFGEGNPSAELMFVGEGPGEQEDAQGRPFVGRAGQLLDKIIEAMGFKRADVYIANVVKCRPPNNRAPEPDEVETCKPFLLQQIQMIRPKVIVALGSTALKCLISPDVQITKMRGKFTEYEGTKLMPTYHPAYLLRNPPAKKDVWEDMKLVKALLRTYKGV